MSGTDSVFPASLFLEQRRSKSHVITKRVRDSRIKEVSGPTVWVKYVVLCSKFLCDKLTLLYMSWSLRGWVFCKKRSSVSPKSRNRIMSLSPHRLSKMYIGWIFNFSSVPHYCSVSCFLVYLRHCDLCISCRQSTISTESAEKGHKPFQEMGDFRLAALNPSSVCSWKMPALECASCLRNFCTVTVTLNGLKFHSSVPTTKNSTINIICRAE